MIDPIKAWHDDHAYFSRLLKILDDQVAIFYEGRHPNFDLMRDIVHYLRHFGDRFHHPREDIAFARLAARDSTIRIQLQRLLQEHRVIAAAGEALLQCLDDISADAIIERSKLEAAAAAYVVYYRHHLATEESEIVPRAAKLFTKKDWAAVAAAVPPETEPRSGDESESRYRELRRHIAIEANTA